MPRLLPTSATACRKFLHKASLMGIDTAALEMQDAQVCYFSIRLLLNIFPLLILLYL